jgi:hypothetical protein
LFSKVSSLGDNGIAKVVDKSKMLVKLIVAEYQAVERWVKPYSWICARLLVKFSVSFVCPHVVETEGEEEREKAHSISRDRCF